MRTLIRSALVAASVLGGLVLATAPAVAAPSDQDVTWLRAAHQSNLAEIAAGNAARQAAATEDVRALGQMFVQMHTELDDQLKPVAQQLGVQLPDQPTATQQQQLAAVQQKSGQAFDTAWIAQQIGSHATALSATQQELQAGSDSQVLQLARTATPVVERHLAQLRSAAQKYGVPTSVPGGSGGQAADDGLRIAGWVLGGAGALALVTAAVWSRRRSSLR